MLSRSGSQAALGKALGACGGSCSVGGEKGHLTTQGRGGREAGPLWGCGDS